MSEQVINLKLQKATKEKVQRFNQLRGVEVNAGDFWDLVVITAVDDRQRAAYEMQIRQKSRRNELPIGPQYRVISDPPGYKIGNGGSTLHALHLLSHQYGQVLSKFRVLLIHAGGFSQRLPNASALGKIFTAVPLGAPLYQMLELKLAMYVDFPSHMKPGLLITCADDIELYSVEQSVQFNRPGFTALAHPSPLSVGTTHGVFVLKPEEDPPVRDAEYRSCWRFLHKPTVEAMRQSDAVFRRAGQDMVYTDSTYYVDYGTVVALLDMFKEINSLRCEIDAYGDFLQSLGPGATPLYTSDTANVMREKNELVQVRSMIFQHLKGTPLNVIVLNESRFYHVGTMEEYLYHFTLSPSLRAELGLQSQAFSVCPEEKQSNVCIMHSVVHSGARVSEGSVVEYSRLEADVTVGQSTIISGCWVDSGLSVPAHTFMHSLGVCVDGRSGFVTIAFGVRDDLKRMVPSPACLDQLEIFEVPLGDCMTRWGLCLDDVGFSGDGMAWNLWNCHLFPVCEDMKTSFSETLTMVRAARGNGEVLCQRRARISLQEVLQNKDLETMLGFRRELFEEITQNKIQSA